MSYSGSMDLSSFYMPQSVSNQTISSGLFEGCLSKQNLFHNEFSMPSLGGNTAIVFSVSLRSDGDASLPIASISINGSDTISSRVGSQITSQPYSTQRNYQSSNPFISTRSPIELNVNILDSGDLIYLNQSTFLMLPIKD